MIKGDSSSVPHLQGKLMVDPDRDTGGLQLLAEEPILSPIVIQFRNVLNLKPGRFPQPRVVEDTQSDEHHPRTDPPAPF